MAEEVFRSFTEVKLVLHCENSQLQVMDFPANPRGFIWLKK